MPDEASRDRSRMAEVLPLERRYARLLDSLPVDRQTPEFVGLGWTLEELRVSLFAQALGAARGASTTKVARALDLAEG
jgi:ATP-dependent helicase HrpA